MLLTKMNNRSVLVTSQQIETKCWTVYKLKVWICLQEHERVHQPGPSPSSQKPRVFNCSSCAKAFAKRSQLERHNRTHTGQRPTERVLPAEDLMKVTYQSLSIRPFSITAYPAVMVAGLLEPIPSILGQRRYVLDESPVYQPSTLTAAVLSCYLFII